MTSDQKQLLHILKWEALVVSGQDNNKMDVIVQCGVIFHKFGCSEKDYVEAFNFCVHISKDVKNMKQFKETIRYLLLLFFLGIFYLVFLLPTATLKS